MSDLSEDPGKWGEAEGAQGKDNSKPEGRGVADNEDRPESWGAVQSNIKSLLEDIKSERKETGRTEKKKLALEGATVALLVVTVILTALTYIVFYEQLQVSKQAINTAHTDADAVLRKSHDDAAAALKKAHEDAAAALTKAHEDNVAALGVASAANTQSGATAKEQERLTRESNSLSREAFTASQRPFVIVKDIQIITDDAGWDFRPIIENAGNTPAKDLAVVQWIEGMHLVFFPDGPLKGTRNFVTEPPDPLTSLYKQPFRSVLGPHSQMPSNFRGMGLSWGVGEDVMKEKVTPFIYWGYVRYRDIIDGTAEHVTKFCYNVQVSRGPNGDPAPALVQCRHWNCTDEQCDDDKRRYETEMTAQLAAWRKIGGIIR